MPPPSASRSMATSTTPAATPSESAGTPRLIGEDPTRDRDGMTLEEFGLPLNLMLAVPATLVVGDAEQALRQLASRRHG